MGYVEGKIIGKSNGKTSNPSKVRFGVPSSRLTQSNAHTGIQARPWYSCQYCWEIWDFNLKADTDFKEDDLDDLSEDNLLDGIESLHALMMIILHFLRPRDDFMDNIEEDTLLLWWWLLECYVLWCLYEVYYYLMIGPNRIFLATQKARWPECRTAQCSCASQHCHIIEDKRKFDGACCHESNVLERGTRQNISMVLFLLFINTWALVIFNTSKVIEINTASHL